MAQTLGDLTSRRRSSTPLPPAGSLNPGIAPPYKPDPYTTPQDPSAPMNPIDNLLRQQDFMRGTPVVPGYQERLRDPSKVISETQPNPNLPPSLNAPPPRTAQQLVTGDPNEPPGYFTRPSEQYAQPTGAAAAAGVAASQAETEARKQHARDLVPQWIIDLTSGSPVVRRR